MKLIVATGLNSEIGKDNSLLWYLPEDLQFFKKMTTGKNVIIGRKTYESIPPSVIAKNDRNWIVISRSNNYQSSFTNTDIIVAGGAEVYRLFEDDVDIIYRTLVHNSYPDADTFYQIPDGFKLIESSRLLTSVTGVVYHNEIWKREVMK